MLKVMSLATMMNLRPLGYSGVRALINQPTMPHVLLPGSRPTSTSLSWSSRTSSLKLMHSPTGGCFSASTGCALTPLTQAFWIDWRNSSGKSYTYCVPIRCALYRLGWSAFLVGYGVVTGIRCMPPNLVVPPMEWKIMSPFSDLRSA